MLNCVKEVVGVHEYDTTCQEVANSMLEFVVFGLGVPL